MNESLKVQRHHLERGAYLPGESTQTDARAFWAYVDAKSEDEDLGAASFLETVHRRHFYFGAADGAKRDFLHHRVCENAFNATGGGKASTLYDAIGAAQVAKASFAGMRLLHHLRGHIPVWPFDPVSDEGPVIVEIYTTLAALAAGRRAGRSNVSCTIWSPHCAAMRVSIWSPEVSMTMRLSG